MRKATMLAISVLGLAAASIAWAKRKAIAAPLDVLPMSASVGFPPVVTKPPAVAPACSRALKDASAAWPNRSRVSDGLLGDAAHRARKSDHNQGEAVDITHDPANGADGNVIARLALQDPRTKYVIWDRKILNRTLGDRAWRAYSGSNPHTKHVHISILPQARDDVRPWPWSPEA